MKALPSNAVEHFIVESSYGLQNSWYLARKGQSINISVVGKVHLSESQLGIIAKTVKPSLFCEDPDTKAVLDCAADDSLRQANDEHLEAKLKEVTQSWIGVEGTTTATSKFDVCKIAPDHNSGALLVAIIDERNFGMGPTGSLEFSDPWLLMNQFGLKPNDFKRLARTNTIEATKDGYLVFIVNEAIFSQFGTKACADLYWRLVSKFEQLSNGNVQSISEKDIPLIWYGDNRGYFRVSFDEN